MNARARRGGLHRAPGGARLPGRQERIHAHTRARITCVPPRSSRCRPGGASEREREGAYIASGVVVVASRIVSRTYVANTAESETVGRGRRRRGTFPSVRIPLSRGEGQSHPSSVPFDPDKPRLPDLPPQYPSTLWLALSFSLSSTDRFLRTPSPPRHSERRRDSR